MQFRERDSFNKFQFTMYLLASFALLIRLVVTPFLLTPLVAATGGTPRIRTVEHHYEEQFVGNQMALAKPTKKAQKNPSSSPGPMLATKAFALVPLLQSCVFFSFFANPPSAPNFDSPPRPD